MTAHVVMMTSHVHVCYLFNMFLQCPPVNLHIYMLMVYNHMDVVMCCD